jgi:hypothetical protein
VSRIIEVVLTNSTTVVAQPSNFSKTADYSLFEVFVVQHPLQPARAVDSAYPSAGAGGF